MSQALDYIFRSLSDSTRRDILQRLCRSELSVSEIADNYEISLPAVSKHLRILENADLVERRRDGKRYMLKSNPYTLQTVDEWMEFYRKFWIDSFMNLDSYLTKIQQGENKDGLE